MCGNRKARKDSASPGAACAQAQSAQPSNKLMPRSTGKRLVPCIRASRSLSCLLVTFSRAVLPDLFSHHFRPDGFDVLSQVLWHSSPATSNPNNCLDLSAQYLFARAFSNSLQPPQTRHLSRIPKIQPIQALTPTTRLAVDSGFA
jgi:hypothetical protein